MICIQNPTILTSRQHNLNTTFYVQINLKTSKGERERERSKLFVNISKIQWNKVNIKNTCKVIHNGDKRLKQMKKESEDHKEVARTAYFRTPK